MDGEEARPTDPGATEAPPPPPSPAAPPRESVLRFWLRPLILAALVIVLLILSWWDQNRTPSEPLRPSQVATVPATANGMSGTAARP